MVLSIQNASDDRGPFYGRPFPLRFLVVSVAVHAVLFLVLQKTISWTIVPPQPKIYNVQLILDPVGAAGENAKRARPETPRTDSCQLQQEETIRLFNVHGEYAAYAEIIKECLESKWMYPEEAKSGAVEGTVMVHFTIEKDGALAASYLAASSNHACLDEKALEAVMCAAPFPPFPEDFIISRLHVEASFTYQLEIQED